LLVVLNLGDEVVHGDRFFARFDRLLIGTDVIEFLQRFQEALVFFDREHDGDSFA